MDNTSEKQTHVSVLKTQSMKSPLYLLPWQVFFGAGSGNLDNCNATFLLFPHPIMSITIPFNK